MKVKNYFVNLWLHYMLQLMQRRKGFVNQSFQEGHISKKVFSLVVNNPVENIHSAVHLVRMILLWARDRVLMDQEEQFDAEWKELGELTKQLMREYEQKFCQEYE